MLLRNEIRLLGDRTTGARVTVVRAGALGDTIVLLPALQLLTEALPSSRLTVVGSVWAERLVPMLPRPWTVLPFESPDLLPLFAREDCDDASGAFRNADLVVIYSSDPASLFVRNVKRLCAGAVICWPLEPTPGTHAAGHLAAAVTEGPPSTDELPLPSLRVSQQARREAERWLRGQHSGENRAPAMLHPGSGGEWKCWPAQRFAELARRLSAEGTLVVLLQGPADGRACDAVCELLFPDNSTAVGRFESLEDVAALISCAAVYVGNDSGITHLAAALGAPTLAVFGPTDPVVWGPLGSACKLVRGTPADDNPSAWPPFEEVCDAALALMKSR